MEAFKLEEPHVVPGRDLYSVGTAVATGMTQNVLKDTTWAPSWGCLFKQPCGRTQAA